MCAGDSGAEKKKCAVNAVVLWLDCDQVIWKKEERYKCIYFFRVAFALTQAVLDARLDARVDQMVQNGLLEEVKQTYFLSTVLFLPFQTTYPYKANERRQKRTERRKKTRQRLARREFKYEAAG